MVERRFFGAFRGWWCCMFPGPSPWPIGHQFVGWGVIKKKIEIPTTLAQQALTLSTTFWEIMTRELHYQQSKQSKITLPVSNSFTADWSIQKWNFGFILHLTESIEMSIKGEVTWVKMLTWKMVLGVWSNFCLKNENYQYHSHICFTVNRSWQQYGLNDWIMPISNRNSQKQARFHKI